MEVAAVAARNCALLVQQHVQQKQAKANSELSGPASDYERVVVE
jgi:hypothetical protein